MIAALSTVWAVAKPVLLVGAGAVAVVWVYDAFAKTFGWED